MINKTMPEYLDQDEIGVYNEYVRKVRGQLTVKAELLQLSEEAAELAAITAKMVRIVNEVNKSPMSIDDALEKVEEEISDVLNCLDVLQPFFDWCKISCVQFSKMARWSKKLNGEQEI